MISLLRSLTTALTATLRLAIIALAIHGGLDLAREALAQEEQQAYMPYAEQSGALADRVAELESLLEHFSREGDTVVVSGANLQVVNGTGTTDGEPNGLGNLVVGYNAERPQWPEDNDRTGSHMVVVGDQHNFAGVGGLMVGLRHSTGGAYPSISGGHGNTAAGDFASVLGGEANTASGSSSTIGGGHHNKARSPVSSVSGGGYNAAEGMASSITGGHSNVTYGDHASVSGGWSNLSRADRSSVCGGSGNGAYGFASTVSGGENRTATDDYNWAAGSLLEER